jgi:hypothetical protein
MSRTTRTQKRNLSGGGKRANTKKKDIVKQIKLKHTTDKSKYYCTLVKKSTSLNPTKIKFGDTILEIEDSYVNTPLYMDKNVIKELFNEKSETTQNGGVPMAMVEKDRVKRYPNVYKNNLAVDGKENAITILFSHFKKFNKLTYNNCVLLLINDNNTYKPIMVYYKMLKKGHIYINHNHRNKGVKIYEYMIDDINTGELYTYMIMTNDDKFYLNDNCLHDNKYEDFDGKNFYLKIKTPLNQSQQGGSRMRKLFRRQQNNAQYSNKIISLQINDKTKYITPYMIEVTYKKDKSQTRLGKAKIYTKKIISKMPTRTNIYTKIADTGVEFGKKVKNLNLKLPKLTRRRNEKPKGISTHVIPVYERFQRNNNPSSNNKGEYIEIAGSNNNTNSSNSRMNGL